MAKIILKEELMIGDWVTVSGTDMQVAAIGRTKAGFLDEKGEMFFHEYENIKPIKLTDEDLRGNYGMTDDGRFVLVDKEGKEKYEIQKASAGSYMFGLHDENKGDEYFPYMIPIVRIKYAHELQHILKVTQIDKED